MIVDDADFDTEWLLNAANHLLSDQDELEAMGEAAATLGIRDADQRLAEFVISVAKGSTAKGTTSSGGHA